MRSWSLRTQLLAMGLFASLGPLLTLLLVVFQVEEIESVEGPDNAAVELETSSGVSPWIPVAAAVLALAAVAMVWGWSKRAVDPIERMTRLIDEVQAGSLDRRLELGEVPIEIKALSESFDRMLDRLEQSSALERRLIEDASHELRTPLAALAARLEVAERRLQDNDLQVALDLELCGGEVDRMRATLDGLLTSARSRQSALEQVDNDVVAIVDRIVERQRLLSPDRHIEVQAPSRLLLGIEGATLERAIANLVTNAIDHGDGRVLVEVRESDDAVEVAVTDQGPGVGPDLLPVIFDRYEGDHHGIGLAIVKQIADAYGEVTVESPVDGQTGARFTLRLRKTPVRPTSG